MSIESVFYEDRQMLRDKMRKKYGGKNLRQAWQNYQEKHFSKPKTRRFVKAVGPQQHKRKRTKSPVKSKGGLS